MKLLNKMNGWQRLFCALIIFIYIPITWAIFPSNPWHPIPSERETLKLMPDEILTLMKDEKVHLNLGKQKIDWDKAVENSRFTWYLVEKSEHLSYDVEIAITKDIKDKEQEKLVDKIYLPLKKKYDHQVLFEKLEFLSYAILIPILFYLFGLTVGWVFRGFKKSPNSQ